MANAKKRRRFEDQNFDEYLKRVNSEEEVGTFDEGVDLIDLKHSNDPLTLTYRKRDGFVFHALLFNGEPTGYARCSLERCRERMKREEHLQVFQCQEYNRSGLQRKFLKRHVEVYHKTEAELEAQRRRSRRSIASQDSSQASMTAFVKPVKKSLNHAAKEKLKQLNAAVIAANDLPLNFFVSEEMLERDRFLLESTQTDPDEVHQFNRGATAVKEDLFKIGNANRQLIKSVAPELAEKSRICLLYDHQSILQLSNETNGSALGEGLLLRATDGKRYQHLLSFKSVDSTGTEATVRHAKQTAQERL